MCKIIKLYLLCVIIFSPACIHVETPNIKSNAEYFSSNQDQFTFLVFGKSAVDTFFSRYSPLTYNNLKLREAITDSLLSQRLDNNYFENAERKISSFFSNTKKPDSMMVALAREILLRKDDKEYFSDCINYLFFYECLPTEFSHKWVQTTLGHFEFNVTFFELLRDKSKELDDLIYGETGEWKEDFQSIFGEYIFNEITPPIAEKIKKTIINDEAFNDKRFASDRANFIEFLDNTISGEWRLVLIDWD